MPWGFSTPPPPAKCLYVKDNGLLFIYLRRTQLLLQYASKLFSNHNNAVFDSIFIPKFEVLFVQKPKAIVISGIWIEPELAAPGIGVY